MPPCRVAGRVGVSAKGVPVSFFPACTTTATSPRYGVRSTPRSFKLCQKGEEKSRERSAPAGTVPRRARGCGQHAGGAPGRLAAKRDLRCHCLTAGCGSAGCGGKDRGWGMLGLGREFGCEEGYSQGEEALRGVLTGLLVQRSAKAGGDPDGTALSLSPWQCQADSSYVQCPMQTQQILPRAPGVATAMLSSRWAPQC